MSIAIWNAGQAPLLTPVRLVSAAQAFTIPVSDGEGRGFIRATGRLIATTTASGGLSLVLLINGVATNISFNRVFGFSTTVSGALNSEVGILGGNSNSYGAFFQLSMFTAKTANGLKRGGNIHMACAGSGGANHVFMTSFFYNDATTVITSIALDCGVAGGIAANSDALVEELRIF